MAKTSELEGQRTLVNAVVGAASRLNARLPILVASAGLVLTACGGPVPPTASTPSSPPLSPQPPVVDCLGGVEQATCDRVLPVALAAVGPSGWTPTHVWINSGFFCPDVGCLFDPTANVPYPMPPEGGKWVANAEIAFAETDKHAGLHIASVGDQLQAVLIGYAVPALTWCSGGCPTSTTTDGPFKLELVLPHLDWRSTDPISGKAILSFAGDAPTVISGSSRPIGFSYVEVGGDRSVYPVWTADCAPHELDPATPMTQELMKSGAIETEFQAAFLPGPEIKLPAGTWDITAIVGFFEGLGCSHNPPHEMKATARVTVTDQPTPR